MILNKHKRFIFIHVHKTSGISIEHVLHEHFPDSRKWHGRHGRAIDGIHEIGEEEWDKFFSFAFIRNPWDRMVSWYAMIESARNKLPFYKRWSKKPFRSRLWNHAIARSHDFESFLKECTDVVFDLGCNKSFAFNQVDYLSNEEGDLVVDFIGRFENLTCDVSTLFTRLGLEGVCLPKLNKSAHSHYSEWYTPITRDLVGERFSRDIATFGYEFEEAAP